MDIKQFLLRIGKVFGSLFITLSIIIILFVVFWWIELCCYQPLSSEDFQALFSEYSSIKKIKSRDALFLTIHGEEYELYGYSIENATPKESFSLDKQWNGQQLSKDARVVPWTAELFMIDDYYPIAESKLKRDFLRYWNNPSALRCCIVSDNNTYWFVYYPEEDLLLYLIYNL